MAEPAATTPDPSGIDRTSTGAIASQTQTTTPEATTAQTSTTIEPSDQTEPKSLINRDSGTSLANQKPQEVTGAPEAYTDYKVPEGYILDPNDAKEANTLFKELNLNQDQAQKLIDMYIAKTNNAQQAPYDTWRTMQEDWVKEVKKDPFLGPRLNQVTSTISKAIDQIARTNPNLAEGFRQAMDFTGAGNNPHFIRMFYEMAQHMTEGGHVSGNGPSAASQRRQGTMPTAAQAMYPNLPG